MEITKIPIRQIFVFGQEEKEGELWREGRKQEFPQDRSFYCKTVSGLRAVVAYVIMATFLCFW